MPGGQAAIMGVGVGVGGRIWHRPPAGLPPRKDEGSHAGRGMPAVAAEPAPPCVPKLPAAAPAGCVVRRGAAWDAAPREGRACLCR